MSKPADAPVLTAEAQGQRRDQRKKAAHPALSRPSAWTLKHAALSCSAVLSVAFALVDHLWN
jgi:hypothetical protein